jgi:Type III restriction enzyme, res subunit
MNHHVNAISGRLSLRPPQRDSLEILDRICEILPPKQDSDRDAALATIQSEFPTVTDFERDFPSLCFSLATGVGKTRLMGAFISYLHLAHGIKNFFVLAPNLTIYNKLIADFTPNTPKYVFKGISEFATDAPEIITGDNYEMRARTLFDELIRCKISRGFTDLKPSAYTTAANEPPRDYRHAPMDKSNMARYIFGGFAKCLYPVQKFQSDAERKLSVILEREALKWFRPAKGQFQIYYRWNGEHPEYQPDFVAEMEDTIYMLEPKMSSQMTDPEVLAKKEVAVRWCLCSSMAENPGAMC